jgi:hypothetical protein
MARKIQVFIGWTAVLAAILIIILAVRGSPSYEECKTAATKQSNTEQTSQFFGVPVIWRCTGRFIDKNDTIILALATVAIAMFTIVLVLVTNRQARLTKEALIADKRSFVFAESIQPIWELDKPSGQYYWRFRPFWRNSGDTPTKRLTLYVDCELRNSLLPVGFNFNQTRIPPGTGMLGPKAGNLGGLAPHMPGVAITPQDILDIQNGRKFLYLWGWARYFDVFPETPQHITRFCWQMLSVGDPAAYTPHQIPSLPGSLIFPYVYHTEGNCADEECT